MATRVSMTAYGVNTILLSGLLGLCNASVGTMHATYLDVSNIIHVNSERSFGGTNGEPASEASQLRKGGSGVLPRKI